MYIYEGKKKEICERRGAGQGVMKTFCFFFFLFVCFFDKKLREWQKIRNYFAPPPPVYLPFIEFVKSGLGKTIENLTKFSAASRTLCQVFLEINICFPKNIDIYSGVLRVARCGPGSKAPPLAARPEDVPVSSLT